MSLDRQTLNIVTGSTHHTSVVDQSLDANCGSAEFRYIHQLCLMCKTSDKFGMCLSAWSHRDGHVLFWIILQKPEF